MADTFCCRLCGSSDLSVCLHLPRAPRNIQRLYTADERHLETAVEVTVHSCNRCGMVQIVSVLQDDYYDDYLMTVSHSRKMRQFQQEQAKDFVQRFGLTGKSVIELGCGDGNYLSYLAEAGARVTGLEPSRSFRALAEQTGYPILSGYVTADRDLEGGPYDAIATRQVLEHVPNIPDFLAGIRRNLRPGGYGLVEVPCLETALQRQRYFDFFTDHLNYFTLRTLRLALEVSGFEVLETHHGMDGEFNVAIVRNPEEGDVFGSLRAAVRTVTEQLQAFIAGERAAGRRVAVWGSGGKGLTAMALADMNGVAYVIDSDPHKTGRLTPVHFLEVRPSTALREDPVDTVVLTALAYKDEIVEMLRGDLAFRGKIALLGSTLEILPSLSGSNGVPT